MKKIFYVTVFLFFILGMTGNAFATDSLLNQNPDALNPKVVYEKLNGIRLTSENPTKTIIFDDGSKAVIEVVDLATNNNEDGRYIKAVSYTASIGPFDTKYTIGADWEVVGFDKVRLNDHWDDVVADINVKVTRFPTKDGNTYGHNVKVWGSVSYMIKKPYPFGQLRHFEFKGYPDGSCTISPISSYPGCP
ncbi:hypothetical protein [Thermosyntropha sp.]|uniref:hypothetical protein n=1 Tax=Thermosyntropha sp. TaxID=2740820 RepID=UPI0025FC08DD|nr:hypothetical protein [Thermosyntropha sp.]MBO8159908.1 hypothetical protein [Thermosyntropha sp.]